MTGVVVRGVGAVSPAGWGAASLVDAVNGGRPAKLQDLPRPGWARPLEVRRVPAPGTRPAILSHPRLRRASPITHYTVQSALEALDDAGVRPSGDRLGVVLCVMAGSVNYSRRFYHETLADPATASPLVFPETVFNAPASHLAALLDSRSLNYTLVGDPGTFLAGLALAAGWLEEGRVDGCLVIGAEEIDWLTADAFQLFDRRTIVSEGAGALYLERGSTAGGSSPSAPGARLERITDAVQYGRGCPPAAAARRMRESLPAHAPGDQLFDSRRVAGGTPDAGEETWADWAGWRTSVKVQLGEGLAAASAWQCVAAVEALRRKQCTRALVSVIGCNQQAIGAVFDVPPDSASSIVPG